MADPKNPDEYGASADKRIKNISSISDAMTKQANATAAKAKAVAVVEAHGTVKDARTAITHVDKVLKNLAKSTEFLASGVKNITVETARGVKNITAGGAAAVSEYAKAVSEDINVNKQSLMVTTIGKISPLVGYSVAKMMETTVFKNMISKMKEGLGRALSSVSARFKSLAGAGWAKLSEFGSSIRDKFSRNRGAPKVKEVGRAEKGLKQKTEKAIEDSKGKAIPKMAEGGFVRKEGMAKVHAAEVVQPVDEVINVIVEQVGKRMDAKDKMLSGRKDDPLTKAANTMSRSAVDMKNNSAKLEQTMLTALDIQKSAIGDAFSEAITTRAGRAAPLERIDEKLGRIAAVVAPFRFIQTMIQNFLSKSPWIRFSLAFFRGTVNTLLSPLKFLFRRRGIGFKPTGNFFNDAGTLMAQSYYKLVEIGQYTDATVNVLVDLMRVTAKDKAYDRKKAEKPTTYSIAGKLWEFGVKKPAEFLTRMISSKRVGSALTQKGVGEGSKDLAKIGYEKLMPEKAKQAMADARAKQKEMTSKFKQLRAIRAIREIGRKGKGIDTEEEPKRGPAQVIPFPGKFKQAKESKRKETPIKDQDSFGKIISVSQEKTRRATEKTANHTEAMKKKLDQIRRQGRKSEDKQKTVISLAKKRNRIADKSNRKLGRIGKGLAGKKIMGWLMTAWTFVSNFISAKLAFLRPLMGAISGGIGPLIAKVAAPLAAALGPALGVAAAGAIGVAIGTAANKYIITPLLDKFYYGKIDKTKKELTTKSDKAYSGKLTDIKEGKLDDQGYMENVTAIKARADLGNKQRKAREKDYGWTTSVLKFQAIQAAQEIYMNQHIGDYTKFGPSQISALRAEWLEKGGFRGLNFGEKEETYGTLREKAFHQYLLKRGKVLGEDKLKAELKVEAYNKKKEGAAGYDTIRKTQAGAANVMAIAAQFGIGGQFGATAMAMLSQYLLSEPELAVDMAKKLMAVKDKIVKEFSPADMAKIEFISKLSGPNLKKAADDAKKKATKVAGSASEKAEEVFNVGKAKVLSMTTKRESSRESLDKIAEYEKFQAQQEVNRAKDMADIKRTGKYDPNTRVKSAQKKREQEQEEKKGIFGKIFDVLKSTYKKTFGDDPKVKARTGMGFESKGNPSFRLQLHDGEVGFISPKDAQERLGIMGGINSKQVASMGANKELFRAAMMKELVKETQGVKGAVENGSKANVIMMSSMADNSTRVANQSTTTGQQQSSKPPRRDEDIDNLLAAQIF